MTSSAFRIRALLLTTLAFLPFSASAQELEPEEGAFGIIDSYEHLLGRQLLSQAPYRFCQFVALPTNGKEATVYITEPSQDVSLLRSILGPPGAVPFAARGPFTVTSVAMKKEFWKALQAAATERERADLAAQAEVTRMSARIDGVTALRLDDLWNAMLQRVHPVHEMRSAPGGDTYHFATFREGVGYPSGMTVSPEAGSRLEALVQVGQALRSYPSRPEAERSAAQDELVALADALLKRLRSER